MLLLKDVPSSPTTYNSSGSLNRYQLSFTISGGGLVSGSDSSQNKQRNGLKSSRWDQWLPHNFSKAATYTTPQVLSQPFTRQPSAEVLYQQPTIPQASGWLLTTMCDLCPSLTSCASAEYDCAPGADFALSWAGIQALGNSCRWMLGSTKAKGHRALLLPCQASALAYSRYFSLRIDI